MKEGNVSINRLDKWDVAVALSSGVLSATLDLVFVNDINLNEAHKWGTEQVADFVQKVAYKQTGYKGDLAGAIRKLESEYEIVADKLTADFGGGYAHHLRDFSHHPTPVGLLFSIITQFTGEGYGTDVNGNFIHVKIEDKSLIGKDFFDKLYLGTVTWALHMVSDMAGSSSSAAMGKEGTGIPGPLMSFLKELSSIPIIKNIAGENGNVGTAEYGKYNFSIMCSKLFNGTLLAEHDESGKIIKGSELKFDLRTELGIAHESIINKQYIPVLLNEIIVRSFYSVRNLCEELKQINSLDELEKINVRNILPINNKKLMHMLTLATTAFSVTDISSATVKAAIKNKNNKAGFAIDVFQGINYFGLGRFAISTTSEAANTGKQLQEKLATIANSDYAKIASRVLTLTEIGTPVGFVSAALGVYQEISEAVKELEVAKEERDRIEKICQENILLIKEYQEELTLLIEDNLTTNLKTFNESMEKMNIAIKDGDVQSFIDSNALLQEFLGYNVQYKSLKEFDDLMLSEEAITF